MSIKDFNNSRILAESCGRTYVYEVVCRFLECGRIDGSLHPFEAGEVSFDELMDVGVFRLDFLAGFEF